MNNKFQGYPAIIVASGPSLDKKIAYLKEAQGKAVILSCDASYQACIQNSVKPDAIVSIERGYPTYQFFFKDRALDSEVVLMDPRLLWSQIFEEYPKKKVLMLKSSGGLEALECSPILVIGQDMAYTDHKIHGNQAHTEFEGENKVEEVSENEGIWVEDIYGGKVLTNDTYKLFRFFMEESIAAFSWHLIDATEGGAKIQRSEIIALQESIEKYCTKSLPYHINDLLSDRIVNTDAYLKKYDEVIESARDVCMQFAEVQDKVAEHFEALMEYKDYDWEHATQEDLYQIVMNMKQADQLIIYLIEEKQDLVTYYQQIIKQTIIYVKKLGIVLRRKLYIEIGSFR